MANRECAAGAQSSGIGFAARLCKAIGKMVVGPPKSTIRSRLQTTSSGCYQK